MTKKTGEVVSTKDTKLTRGGRAEPKIVGAASVQSPEATKVLDRNTMMEPQEIVIRTHNEVVTVRSHVRSRPLRKDEPDVRVRTQTPEDKAAWERAKRAED